MLRKTALAVALTAAVIAAVTAADTPSMPASTVSATPTAVSLPLTSVASAASIMSLVSTAAFVEWAFMPTTTITAAGDGSQPAWGIGECGSADRRPGISNPTSSSGNQAQGRPA